MFRIYLRFGLNFLKILLLWNMRFIYFIYVCNMVNEGKDLWIRIGEWVYEYLGMVVSKRRNVSYIIV